MREEELVEEKIGRMVFWIWNESPRDMGDVFAALEGKFETAAAALESLPLNDKRWAEIEASRYRSIASAFGVLSREFPLIGSSAEAEGGLSE